MSAVISDFSLTLTQRDIYFDQICHPDTPIYNIGGYVQLGAVDPIRVQQAHAMLVRAHDAFGIRILSSKNGTRQRIVSEDKRTIALPIIDLSEQPTPTELAGERVTRLFESPLPYEDTELFKAFLFKLSESEYWYVGIAHHLMCDGWGFINWGHALAALYNRPAQDQSVLCWRDIAASDENYQTSERHTRDRDYWRDELEILPERLLFPRYGAGTGQVVHRSLRHVVTLAEEEQSRLQQVATDIGVGVAHVLLAVVVSCMGLSNGQSDLVVGLPIHNRRGEAQKKAISVFTSVSPMRLSVTSGQRFSQIARHVAEKQKANFRHQRYPIGDIVRDLGRSGEQQKIYDIGFSYLNFKDDVEFEENLSKLVYVSHSHESTPLLVTAWECGGSIEIKLDCNRSYFSESDARLLGNRLVHLLNLVTLDPDKELTLSDVLPAEERAMLLTAFNATTREYPKDRLIHELFEVQAAKAPDAIAVVCEEEHLTYQALNHKANQLAHYLRSQGVGPDELVAICVERSVEMVVGLLGILKAGCAYVPLDLSYPPERLLYMLKDAAPGVVLTQERLKDALPTSSATLIAVDSQWDDIAKHPTTNLSAPELGITSSHLAYVIYTSGSTGEPKGVMVEHANVARLFSATQDHFQFSEHDVWSLFHSIAFDFSVWELWGALFHGGRLIVVPLSVARSPSQFYRLLCDQGVTVLNQTPSAFMQLSTEQVEQRERNTERMKHALRLVIFGGETLELKKLQPWVALNGIDSPRLVNMYGITETTVHVTQRFLSVNDVMEEHRSLVGRPLPDLQLYLLDSHHQPVPIGVAGEIYIGGAGVARGYLHRPELTAERFIADPFSSDPNARLYKSGDLGLYRLDGNIEYLGRNDHQVKIRGFRIELGEIESQLTRHEGIKEAIVIAREESGEKRLVAYYTAKDNLSLDIDSLRAHLKEYLPGYMVPSAYVHLASIPLTTNGKVDRKALPAPDLSALSAKTYEAPQGEIEGIVAGIWQDLLQVERVGRWDNFFELGGHSLLIAQLIERLRAVGIPTDVRSVFSMTNLADLAKTIRTQRYASFVAPENLIIEGSEVITPEMLPLIQLDQGQIDRIIATVPGGARNVQDIYPLAPLQEGILFHHLLNDEHDTYIASLLLSIDSQDQLGAFLNALQGVIDRHDNLRTAVVWEGLSRAVQVVHRHAKLPVEMLQTDETRDVLEQLQALLSSGRMKMDLHTAPLLRLQIARNPGSERWYVLLSQHHLISDHVSLEVVQDEIAALLAKRMAQLSKPVPYREYVAQALAQAESGEAAGYFRSKLADIDEPTVPYGLLDVHGDGRNIEESHQGLSAELAKRIRTSARRYGVSSATLFHVAWSLVVARTSGRDDVVFGTVLSGRLQGTAGADRVMGVFINTLPLRVQLKDVSVKHLVGQVQRELMELLRYEQASLAEAQRSSGIRGNVPLFSAMLNYRHSVVRSAKDQEGNEGPARGIRALAAQERSNYPIAMSVDDLGEGFSLTAQTDRRVEASRVAGYLHTAIESVVEALESGKDTPVLQLTMMPELERHQLLREFNATEVAYPKDRLIHELFEVQAAKAPDAIAVVCEEEHLTYQALNHKANQLAHYLRSQGVGPDELVAICVERSVEMVVGLLGILKAGCAYVPLDLSYPPERLLYMLKDAAPGVVLTQERLKDSLPTSSATLIAVDSQWDDIAKHPTTNLSAPELGITSSHLAYVIYTSGSTGEPKGVMVEHHSVVRLVTSQDYVQLDSNTVMAQASNTSFDAATFEIWGALLNGGRLVVVEKDTLVHAERLAAQIQKDSISVLFVTTALFNHHAQGKPDCFAALGTLLFGGEAVSPRAVATIVSQGMPGRLLHVYGPTETTTFSTWFPVTSERLVNASTVPIGRGFADTRLYVLTPTLQPVPVGVSGELFIAGAGLARGYLNRDELSAERFLNDPFASEMGANEIGARMYKTGDLVRWSPDGSLEFLGRRDSQIKLRGFRIELGEIEGKLATHPNVCEARVLMREDVPGDNRLVAYLTCRDEKSFSAAQLRAHLAAHVPDYMLPSAFVVLDAFPLTPNGKLDRDALPAPQGESFACNEYEPPQGHTEEMLAEIWQELLRVPRIGRHDNFSGLGGHSLLAITLSVRIQEKFQIRLPLEALFGAASLASLSELIVNAQAKLFSEKEVEEMQVELDSMSDEDLLAYLED